jgi:hypothetical protein
MTWNAVFPTGPTLISQSVNQIQTNWAFINTFANTDHYFNSGTANEGHHRFAQMIVQGADVAPGGVGANLSLYSKNDSAGNPKIYDNTTASGVRQINSFGIRLVGPAGPGTFGIIDFTGVTERCNNGIVTVSQTNIGSYSDCAMAYFNYDGNVVFVRQIFVSGGINSISAGGAGTKFVLINTSNTASWNVCAIQMEV